MSADWWSSVAYFLDRNLFDPHPVYHRRIEFSARSVSEDGTVTLRTACGIVSDQWNRETGERIVNRGMCIRRDYADRFARPCKLCWPEARP